MAIEKCNAFARRTRAAGVIAFFICALLLYRISANAASAFEQEKFFDFVQRVDKFNRKLLGCPAEGFPPAIECFPSAGIMDAKLWKEVNDRGRDLFAKGK